MGDTPTRWHLLSAIVVYSLERELEMEFASLTATILDRACKVHSVMGIGLLESVYQRCLAYELEKAGLSVESEVAIPVKYQEVSFDCTFRADIVVNSTVLLELKAVERITEWHKAQVINYLGLTGLPVALLLNFNEIQMTAGIRRFENRLIQTAPTKLR